MKLSALIARLEELQEELRFVHGAKFDPDVVAAHQESYPLAGVVLGAAAQKTVVWLAIGGTPPGMSPYAPRSVFDEVEG